MGDAAASRENAPEREPSGKDRPSEKLAVPEFEGTGADETAWLFLDKLKLSENEELALTSRPRC